MLDSDAEVFDRVMQDLCLAFNRPHTPELTRVYWESLRQFRVEEIKRAAFAARNNFKKFPTPKDLTPEKRVEAPAQRVDDGPEMSRWAIAANRILMALAYYDERRGFNPIAKWEPMPDGGWGMNSGRRAELLDGLAMRACLAAKADYVRMAEQAEADGDPMGRDEFQSMCREGFERLLGTRHGEPRAA